MFEAGQEPLRSLRLEYPVLQLAAPLNAQGQGYLLLQEKRWVRPINGCGACAARSLCRPAAAGRLQDCVPLTEPVRIGGRSGGV